MSLFYNRNKSFVRFDAPEEGGDGLREMIEEEQQNGFNIFKQETGADLADYLDKALAIGGVALSDSDREA